MMKSLLLLLALLSSLSVEVQASAQPSSEPTNAGVISVPLTTTKEPRAVTSHGNVSSDGSSSSSESSMSTLMIIIVTAGIAVICTCCCLGTLFFCWFRRKSSFATKSVNNSNVDNKSSKSAGGMVLSTDDGMGAMGGMAMGGMQNINLGVRGWSTEDVKNWVDQVLSHAGLGKFDVINPFLYEFEQKKITGNMLLRFRNNDSLIEEFRKEFRKGNQYSAIWMAIKEALEDVFFGDDVGDDVRDDVGTNATAGENAGPNNAVASAPPSYGVALEEPEAEGEGAPTATGHNRVTMQ